MIRHGPSLYSNHHELPIKPLLKSCVYHVHSRRSCLFFGEKNISRINHPKGCKLTFIPFGSFSKSFFPPYQFRYPLPSRLRLSRRSKLAFPDDEHSPAGSVEERRHSVIPSDILLEFFHPKCRVAFRCCGNAAVGMPVPEASVDENHGLVPRKHKVGLAGQVSPI